ncbi:MAG: hypothetical protein IPG24_25075 [Leptospiraceae bacterium]|nr:hypothetical protein [Leptospiraceae bacterium]
MTKDLAPIDKDHFERQKEDLKFLFVKNKQIKEGLDIDDISVGDINAKFSRLAI